MNNATRDVITEKLRVSFATHSLSEVVVTDNGTYFTSQDIETFMRRNGNPVSNISSISPSLKWSSRKGRADLQTKHEGDV